MFWNTSSLKERLPKLISDYSDDRVERANYTLRIGREVYVSPTEEPKNMKEHSKIQLGDDEGFTIPAGQFGFLLTEEKVTVPSDAIAFISIRSRYKFRGLLDVSGFHVDPGFTGNLVFAVYNAGPSPIHLSQGEECFHIWYADLEKEKNNVGPKLGKPHLDSSLIQQLSSQILSLKGLSYKINAVEQNHRVLITIGFVAISLLVPLVVALFSKMFSLF